MIEAMYFVTVTGPKEDLERVTDQYLSQYSIQLENALTVLRNNAKLVPLTDKDPYREIYAQSENMRPAFGDLRTAKLHTLSADRAVEIVHELSDAMDGPNRELAALREEKQALEERLSLMEQFIGLNYDLDTILHFKYLRYRFGRISKEYYAEMMEYVISRGDSIFTTCRSYDDYVWGVYFVPEAISARVDSVYASLHFERFFLPDEYTGTPQEASRALQEKIADTDQKIAAVSQKLSAMLEERKSDFLSANRLLEQKSRFFGVRRLAAFSKHDGGTYYILCGWMRKKEALSLKRELDPDPLTYCVVEKDRPDVVKPPPTLLKNGPLTRPFELFVEMYGLPNYRELDPTSLIAFSYSFFFGFMFGDLGQGLCLALIGAIIARRKNSRLGAIIARCGIFSAVFGVLFGSVFGLEDMIPALWLRPAEALMQLPGIGKLNAVFIIAILIGMCMILLMMGFSVVNHLRLREPGEAYFDTNGLAGMVFYLSLLSVVLLALTGRSIPGHQLMALLFALPLLLIFLKEPLSARLLGQKHEEKEDPVMFIVQGFFELFEVLLSYFSNTLSFVRVGAFAVSHASMMGVVLMLSGAGSGQIGWPGIVLGNIFVCCMEGLIVGIQVLRLEYYELFSRFYRGDGRPFKPYNLKQSV